MHSSDYTLRVRQQPKYARVAIGKEKDRKPIDPPPIVQLTVSPRKDPSKQFLQNPYLILTSRLVSVRDEDSSPEEQHTAEPKESDLTGTVVSSLYSLKDTDNSQGGFFVFGDLSVRREGEYRLQFTLYEIKQDDFECWLLARVVSEKFTVYAQKHFPGMMESTFLTRSFSDQGVRLRLRKDSRSMTTRKRNHAVANTFDQIRSSQAGTAMYPGQNDVSPDLSPNGHAPGPFRRTNSLQDPSFPPTYVDRPRGSMGSRFQSDSPQMREMREYSSGTTYPNYGYNSNEPPAKRQRPDPSEGSHAYENEYPAYQQSGPRTVPVPLESLYTASTSGYQMGTLAAMSGHPNPLDPSPQFNQMPRIDTQLPSHHTGPNSATSNFSPNTQRSPGAGTYHYPPQPQPMYQSPASLGYPIHGTSPPLSQVNGLHGLGLPNLALEGADKQSTVNPGI
ncbi:velvet factor-domain-containing protein [Lasiosphaeris hirsuta]|uniref:Velvet factor-domain-containing protein n=1 Tax=Lasiosphaeris hirsuta TaxID=260670 RepID=A0AA40A2V2_9PEZI|nr:velvet factor-domain-containing protein [Lasiosphaeris hirsuta]